MDRLTIFQTGGDVSVKLTSEGGASLDTLVRGQEQATLELRKLRAGKEQFDWGASVDGDIDPEDYLPEEVIDGSE